MLFLSFCLVSLVLSFMLNFKFHSFSSPLSLFVFEFQSFFLSFIVLSFILFPFILHYRRFSYPSCLCLVDDIFFFFSLHLFSDSYFTFYAIIYSFCCCFTLSFWLPPLLINILFSSFITPSFPLDFFSHFLSLPFHFLFHLVSFHSIIN